MKKQGDFHPDHDAPASRFRCWDGHLGCEQNKPESEFRWHPLICSQCCAVIASRHGMKQSDIALLALLLASEESLIRGLLYEGASKDRIGVLRAGQEGHIKRLADSIHKAGANNEEVKRVASNYRAWVRRQALGEPELVGASHDHALPTGDRA